MYAALSASGAVSRTRRIGAPRTITIDVELEPLARARSSDLAIELERRCRAGPPRAGSGSARAARPAGRSRARRPDSVDAVEQQADVERRRRARARSARRRRSASRTRPSLDLELDDVGAGRGEVEPRIVGRPGGRLGGVGGQRIGARRDDRGAGGLLVELDLDSGRPPAGAAVRVPPWSSWPAPGCVASRRSGSNWRRPLGSAGASRQDPRSGCRIGASRRRSSLELRRATAASVTAWSSMLAARCGRARSSSRRRNLDRRVARARADASAALAARARPARALELARVCSSRAAPWRARARARAARELLARVAASSARCRSASFARVSDRAAGRAPACARFSRYARSPARAEHDGEVLHVRRDRRVVVAQPLEQPDPLVDLAVAMRVAEHEHEQLGGGVVIDDRHRDAGRLARRRRARC